MEPKKSGIDVGSEQEEKKRKGSIGNIAMWGITIFMALGAISFFPSIATFLMALFVAIALPISVLQEFWESHGLRKWIKTILLILLFIAAVATAPTGSKEKDDSPDKSLDSSISSQASSKVNDDDKEKEEQHTQPEINFEMDTSEYIKVDAEVLYEYGKYMQGEKVVTVITIADVANGLLKAHTDNNDGVFFSINCEFQDKDYPKQFSEDDVVTIAGEITDNSSHFGETVVLENCSVIGLGEIAEELKSGADEQRKVGEDFKASFEKAESDAIQAEKDDYISQCTTVTYSDVERNPDNYKGEKIKVTGKVVQVSEGWFDTVTMRIESNGDMWYVTYSREDGESRILEDDRITCYGECDGVESYTTILGSQVTIPSMKMKYYD